MLVNLLDKMTGFILYNTIGKPSNLKISQGNHSEVARICCLAFLTCVVWA